jgi:hypothetical protein
MYWAGRGTVIAIFYAVCRAFVKVRFAVVKSRLKRIEKLKNFKAISEYKIEYPGLFAGLKVMCLKDDKIVEKRTLLLEWDDIRLKLTQRNAELINLRNRCVISV